MTIQLKEVPEAWQDMPETGSLQGDPLLFEDETLDDEEPKKVSLQTPHTKRPRISWGTIVCCGLLFLLLVVLIPVIVVTLKDEEGSKVGSADPVKDIPKSYVLDFDMSLPKSTLAVIESDELSPQARAYNWVMKDPSVAEYSTERLVQRFALATLYYATNGDEWNSTMLAESELTMETSTENWLSYDTPECEWTSKNTKAKNGHSHTGIKNLCESSLDHQQHESSGNPVATARHWGRGGRRRGHRGGYYGRYNYNSYYYGYSSYGYSSYSSDSYDSYSYGGYSSSGKSYGGYYGKSSSGKSYGYYYDDDDYYYYRGRQLNANDKLLENKKGNLKVKPVVRRQVRRGLQQQQQQRKQVDWKPVRGLHFPGNNLRGTIPPEISLLTSVESIDLSGNFLNGHLPPQIFEDMQELKSLSLQYNFLSGSLPSEIGEWGKASNGNGGELTLDLAHNAFGQTIPPALGSLSNLMTLNLADNRFTGPLMFSNLGSLTNLKRLLVHQNQFTGKLSESIGSLTLLKLLEVDNNRLSGTLPSELGKLEQVQRFLAFKNMLMGSLPSELGSMEALRVLGLGGNRLTGPIPSTLGMLTSLEHLWLYDNELTSLVPSHLGNLMTNGELQLMMLYNNSLIGTIPESLCSLKEFGFDCAEQVEARVLCGCDCSCHEEEEDNIFTSNATLVGNTTQTNETLPELNRETEAPSSMPLNASSPTPGTSNLLPPPDQNLTEPLP